ncbi:MAG: hypothetical protein KDD45_15480 [Bdellovibrionales bacterium]|nr:hypothetical protein [Bdellovibrionales bacterium]
MKTTITSTSSENFCNQIAELTERVSDAHLTVHIENQTCRREWQKASVGRNSGYGQPNSTWYISFKNYHDKLVPILSIQKMSSNNSPEWDGFLETVQKLVTAKESFILDMRGNPGGDATKGMEMARILYGLDRGMQIPMPLKKIYRRQTIEAWSILANTFRLKIQNQIDVGQTPSIYLNETYQTILDFRRKSIDGLIPDLDIETFGSMPVDLSQSFTSNVYLLIDRNCGSSCELTLEALENLSSVITVGENTTGVVQFGNVGSLYLPSSHIVVRIPTQGAIYTDQRQIEKIGYSPKWNVPSGLDALDYALDRFF